MKPSKTQIVQESVQELRPLKPFDLIPCEIGWRKPARPAKAQGRSCTPFFCSAGDLVIGQNDEVLRPCVETWIVQCDCTLGVWVDVYRSIAFVPVTAAACKGQVGFRIVATQRSWIDVVEFVIMSLEIRSAVLTSVARADADHHLHEFGNHRVIESSSI